jgi:hypothetical protein
MGVGAWIARTYLLYVRNGLLKTNLSFFNIRIETNGAQFVHWLIIYGLEENPYIRDPNLLGEPTQSRDPNLLGEPTQSRDPNLLG